MHGTRDYIDFKLQAAKAHDYLFTKESYYAIHQYTKGIPRLINTLCDNCLLEGFILRQDLIDESIVERVAYDIGLGKNYEGYSQLEFTHERRPSFYDIESDKREEDSHQRLKEKIKEEIIREILGKKM